VIATVAAVALAGAVAGTVIRIRTVRQGSACAADARSANLDFTLSDIRGEAVALSQFVGKVILLNFWATWCGPCKIEIPEFIDFQNRYGKDGLQVIGVSVDDTLDKLVPYARDMQMNYPVLQGLGHENIQDAYGPMYAIPVTVVISRDGKICSTHMGYTSKEIFEEEIKSLLAPGDEDSSSWF
jgi:peroxiredoxin